MISKKYSDDLNHIETDDLNQPERTGQACTVISEA
jgi:hypothetical protein